MLAHGFQRVRIEKAIALKRYAADETVVERAFQDVVVFRFTMQQEQTVVHIDITDGGTGFAVGAHIRQLIILSEGLAAGSSTYASGDVEFLANDIIPDSINSLDIAFVARQRCHIGHTGIHIGSTNGMPHSLSLLYYRQMTLTVFGLYLRLSTIVEQELCEVQVFLLACCQIQAGHSHLCNLMTWHHTHLSGVGTHFFTSHVSIATSDIEELALASSLPVGHSTLDHVAKVVELMRQVFLLHPTAITSPVVRVGRILCTSSIQVTVGLLGRRDDVYHRVTIGFQLLIGICLEDVGSTLERLVGVGIVERIPHAIDLKNLRGVSQVGGSIFKVLVAALALTLREGERNGSVAAGFEPLTPERARRHLDGGEGHGSDGVACLRHYG